MSQEVYLKTLKRKAELLEGPDTDGKYLVQYGSFQLRIAAGDFEAVLPASKKKQKKPKPISTSVGDRTSSIDLHGMTADEAIRQLETALDRALLKGVERLDVIHGIGTGTLLKATHAYLRNSKHVARFSVDERNQGTTLVYLR